MYSYFKISICIVAFLIEPITIAQSDTIVVKSGDILVGEMKSMSRGVVTLETPYSSSDFKLEWDKVTNIYSKGDFIVSLESGARLITTIRTKPSDSSTVVIFKDGKEVNVPIADIVFIKGVDEGFVARLSASIDLGFTLTKANNLRQFSSRSSLGYLSNKWSADVTFDAVRSEQDSIANTERTEASAIFSYFLWDGWFVFGSASFLQNDEQKLKLRSTPKAGIGNYIIRTNEMYWSLFIGMAWNNETYTDPTIPNRSDAESNIGTELNLFDIGDLRFLTSLSVYKSITDGGRIRADYKFDLNYDLPLNFYIGLGFTLNFDNRPVEGASETDYVFQTAFGWEL
jgi:putative salt-induced outer membrane protein YdiY